MNVLHGLRSATQHDQTLPRRQDSVSGLLLWTEQRSASVYVSSSLPSFYLASTVIESTTMNASYLVCTALKRSGYCAT